jgi:chromosome segregation ATPase
MELSEKSSELLLRTEEKKEYLKQIEQLTSQLTKLETILIDSKLGITEKTSEAKDLTSRFNEIRQKQEDLIRKIESLMEENRVANEQIRNLNSTMEVLQTFKKENAENIVYFKKLSKLMKEEPIFKTFLIIRDLKKGISMEDLRITIGAPIVLVKKFVQKFQELDLVDVKEDGKIVLKPVEIS